MKPKLFYIIILLPLLLASCSGNKTKLEGYSGSSYAELGDYLREKGKTECAVKAYMTHMKKRLNKENLKNSENPYFYYILIGDTYLDSDNIEMALSSYNEAKEKNVERSLLADRFKLIAKWYEKDGKYDQAFEILKSNRELDPISIDLAIDSLHKKYIGFKKEERSQMRLALGLA